MLSDLRKAVDAEAWYAATALAVALPDICAQVDEPEGSIGIRYKKWARTYFEPLMRAAGKTFFSAEELYLLRCRFLHQGDFEISDKPSDDSFGLATHINLMTCPERIVPSRVYSPVCESKGRAYYLTSVSEFCESITNAVQEWLRVAQADPVRTERMEALLKIEHLDHRGLPQ